MLQTREISTGPEEGGNKGTSVNQYRPCGFMALYPGLMEVSLEDVAS